MAFRKKRRDPFTEIQQCLQRRDYKGALDWFHTLLQKDRQNTQIRLRFADTLVLAGSKREAVKQYRIVADELSDKGFMIRAIAINKKILQLDPNQRDVHERLAEMSGERRASPGKTTNLADVLTPPDAPLRRHSESPGAAAAPSKPPVTLPELSLEESMAMEFGAPAEEVDETKAPAPTEPTAAGFELVDESAPGSPPAPAERPRESEEDPALEAEPSVSPSFSPSFSEEPIELGGEEPAAAEEVSEDGLLTLETSSLEDFEEVAEGEESAPLGTGEMEVVAFELESEPSMSAEGEQSLLAALGEDIDSLIDSIVDDVGISAKGAPTEEKAPTHIPLFSDLTSSEFIDVALMLYRRVAKVGEIIVKEGDPGDSMFIVSTGEVRATAEREGQQVPVATMKDGDFFGEMAVLSGEPRTATVTAVKATELLELNRDHLREICSRHPHVEAKIRLAYDERVARSQARSGR